MLCKELELIWRAFKSLCTSAVLEIRLVMAEFQDQWQKPSCAENTAGGDVCKLVSFWPSSFVAMKGIWKIPISIFILEFWFLSVTFTNAYFTWWFLKSPVSAFPPLHHNLEYGNSSMYYEQLSCLCRGKRWKRNKRSVGFLKPLLLLF